MKKLLFPLFMLAMIVTSCEKDPDMNKLDSDYSVYTDYDNSAHFNEFSTYYLPDSILVPDNSLKANYWKDENAQNIISAVAHEMEQKGYVRTEDKEKSQCRHSVVIRPTKNTNDHRRMVWRLVGCRILGALLGRRMVLSLSGNLQL